MLGFNVRSPGTLDTGDDLALNVGFDIPSAEQVAKLQSQVSWWNPKSKTLMEAWEEMQKEVKTVAKRKEVYQTNLERWAKMRKKPAPPAEEVEESKKPDPPSAEEAEESEPSQQIVSNRISRSKTVSGFCKLLFCKKILHSPCFNVRTGWGEIQDQCTCGCRRSISS
jgi:hypothetical protein